MRAFNVRVVLVLCILALPGTAAAAGEDAVAPVTGHMTFALRPLLEGHATAEASGDAIMDLSAAVAQGDPISVSWSSGEIHEGAMARVEAGGPGVAATPSARSEPEEHWIGAGELVGFSCEAAECLVVAYLYDEPGSSLTVDGTSLGTIRSLPKGRAFIAQPDVMRVAGIPTSKMLGVAAEFDWLAISTAGDDEALSMPGARASGEGVIRFLLWNASATLRTQDGAATRYDAGIDPTVERRAGPATATVQRVRTLQMDFYGARLEVAAGAPIFFTAPEFEFDVDGTLTGRAVAGSFHTPAGTRDLRDDVVRLDGTFHAIVRHERKATDDAADEVEDVTTSPDVLLVDARGDATRLSFGARTIVDDPRPASAAAVAGALGIAAILLLFASRLLPLYSRLSPGRLLDHPLRASLHALVAEHPGIHASEAARVVGASRVTVQHHLRALAGAGIVVSARRGRRVGYFLPSNPLTPEDRLTFLSLRAATRARVLEAVRAAPAGATQADLVTATGLAQRLVSYHLDRLRALGLVEWTDERPRRYRAAAAAALEIQEEGPKATEEGRRPPGKRTGTGGREDRAPG